MMWVKAPCGHRRKGEREKLRRENLTVADAGKKAKEFFLVLFFLFVSEARNNAYCPSTLPSHIFLLTFPASCALTPLSSEKQLLWGVGDSGQLGELRWVIDKVDRDSAQTSLSQSLLITGGDFILSERTRFLSYTLLDPLFYVYYLMWCLLG